MRQAPTVVIVIGLAVVASLMLLPPFPVVDLAAPTTRHTALGHYPLWRPPTPATAQQVLTGSSGHFPSRRRRH